jgi:hypothetical protein
MQRKKRSLLFVPPPFFASVQWMCRRPEEYRVSLFFLLFCFSLSFFCYCELANDGGLSPLTSPHWVHPPSLSTPLSVDAPFRFIFHRFGTFFSIHQECVQTRDDLIQSSASLFLRVISEAKQTDLLLNGVIFLFPDPRAVYRMVIPQNSPYPAVPET